MSCGEDTSNDSTDNDNDKEILDSCTLTRSTAGTPAVQNWTYKYDAAGDIESVDVSATDEDGDSYSLSWEYDFEAGNMAEIRIYDSTTGLSSTEWLHRLEFVRLDNRLHNIGHTFTPLDPNTPWQRIFMRYDSNGSLIGADLINFDYSPTDPYVTWTCDPCDSSLLDDVFGEVMPPAHCPLSDFL
jgi:hypothetical protein